MIRSFCKSSYCCFMDKSRFEWKRLLASLHSRPAPALFALVGIRNPAIEQAGEEGCARPLANLDSSTTCEQHRYGTAIGTGYPQQKHRARPEGGYAARGVRLGDKK